MNDKTGGPAFPGIKQFLGDNTELFSGMTLRDYFAGQAMQGLIANKLLIKTVMNQSRRDGQTTDELIAECCYDTADAMIEQKLKGE